MTESPVVSASEMEKLSPNEREQLLNERSLDDLTELTPEFRGHVEAKGRRLLEERGLLDVEQS